MQADHVVSYVRFGTVERCNHKTKCFYLGHFWSVQNMYAYPAKIISQYVQSCSDLEMCGVRIIYLKYDIFLEFSGINPFYSRLICERCWLNFAQWYHDEKTELSLYETFSQSPSPIEWENVLTWNEGQVIAVFQLCKKTDIASSDHLCFIQVDIQVFSVLRGFGFAYQRAHVVRIVSPFVWATL